LIKPFFVLISLQATRNCFWGYSSGLRDRSDGQSIGNELRSVERLNHVTANGAT